MSCNVLYNPSFEAGLTGWYTTPETGFSVGNAVPAYSGSYYAYCPFPLLYPTYRSIN